MFPDVTGKRAVDLGCGFGWGSRWLRENGARHVLGLDLSENMRDQAGELTDDVAIYYRVEDRETIDLPERAFDCAYSSFTFHYVRDFDRLSRVIHRSLSPGS